MTAELTVPTTESWRAAIGFGAARATEARAMRWRNFMMMVMIEGGVF